MIYSCLCEHCHEWREVDLKTVPRNFAKIVLHPLKPVRSGSALMSIAVCKTCGRETKCGLVKRINERIFAGETEVISYGS